ncbi:hypothetical protein HMPREF9554_00749 [Treponema phagedenis F0421]|nr:hypothetical protein HMPREF9554_00749 [Treponema phagedenis F0421]
MVNRSRRQNSEQIQTMFKSINSKLQNRSFKTRGLVFTTDGKNQNGHGRP